MTRDKVTISPLRLESLALDRRTPLGVRYRSLVIAAKAERAGLTMSGSFVPHREISRIYEFRLKHQIKRNKPITPGLPEYVEELRKIDGHEEIMLCALSIDEIFVNIFAVGAPTSLIGFVSKPPILLPDDLT